MKLYVYSKPNVMDGYKALQDQPPEDIHSYTDDVALCFANSLEEAIHIFRRMYDIHKDTTLVHEAQFNQHGVCVCTDY